MGKPTVIGVVGAGALGTLIAARLAAAGVEVVVVDADPEVVEAAGSRGLMLEEDGVSQSGPVRAYLPGDEPEEAADAVIVAVKSYHTQAAAPHAARLSRGIILTVQNGLGNYEILERHAPGRVVQGVSTWGATRTGPAAARLGGVGSLYLGHPPPGLEWSHGKLVEALRRAGLRPVVEGDIWKRLWEKVAVNAGINPVTALARRPNGAIVGDPNLWEVASKAAVEASLVAEAEGHGFGGPQAAVEALERVARATSANYSSMLQDILACRRTEVEAINGEVYRRAEKHGLDAPVNRTLYMLVRGLEAREECRPHG